MDLKSLISIFLIFLHLEFVYCANILMIQPTPVMSHFQFFKPLAEETIKRGHNLTLISLFHLSDHFHSNYTFISLEKSYQNLNISLKNLMNKSKIQNVITNFDIGSKLSHAAAGCPDIKKVFLSEDHYDLIIAEFFFLDFFLAVGSKFKAPVVSVTSQSLAPFQNWIIGQEFPASYVPNTYLPLTENMTLISRIYNAFINMFSILYYEFIDLPNTQTLIEKHLYFGERKVPQIRDILKNISVFLVNAHYSFGYPKPDLPNAVNVAGLHLTPPKPLPEFIKLFMDGAEQGVIYISFGSIISPNSYQSLGEILIRILERVPQRVIMKWDRKLLPNTPSSILVQEWLPQADILSHTNCRLFISHGGLMGLLESLNASVPIIGIPFHSDQHYNMAIVQYYGIGTELQTEEVPTKLLEKVEEVLTNPKYKKNIEKRSRLFRDRLVNPLDEAMFWLDHVIKHKDTSHLIPASIKLAWYKLYSLDVFAIFAISFLSILYLTKFIISFTIRKLMFVREKICLNFKKTDKINQKSE